MVHPIWATSMEKFSIPSFLLSNKMKEYNLHHIHCKFLFTLSQYLSRIHKHNTQLLLAQRGV